MAEENTKDKSAYIFVDASTTKPDKSYADKPVYSYVYSAWEWLLERTLRRKLILSMFNKDAALAALTLHSGCYRMHRWPSFGNGSGCSSFEDSTHTYDATCHDGTLKNYTEQLPSGEAKVTVEQDTAERDTAEQDTAVKAQLSLTDIKTVLGIIDIANEVYSLVYDIYGYNFLAPGCFPQVGFSTTAVIREKTIGTQKSDGSGILIWKSDITGSLPYALPDHAFLRFLTDYRIDDPAVEVTINDSKGESHNVTIAKTVMAKRREDLPELDGKKVLYGGYSPMNCSGILSFGTKTGLDNILSETITAQGTPYGNRPSVSYVGIIPGPIERVDDSAIYAVLGNAIQPNIDWDGEPTWWHANGFPVGLDSILSPSLREQLISLSVTQPSIPPNIPYLHKFPQEKFNCYEDGYVDTAFKNWPSGILSLAATPICISKMLDALTTTVIEVPSLFFVIDSSTIRNNKTTSTMKTESSETTTWTNVKTETSIKGTLVSSNILVCDNDLKNSSEADYINEEGITTNTDNTAKTESSTIKTTGLKTNSTISKIVVLRNTTYSTKTSYLKTIVTTVTADDDLDGTKRTEKYGAEPDVTTPKDSDILFPTWVMKWVNKAELFMAYETKLSEGTPYKINEIRGESVNKNGEGSRVTKSRKGVISLGVIGLNGEINNIDLVSLRKNTDPSSEEVGHSINGATNKTTVISKINDISTVEEHTEYTPGAEYSRSSKLFVVVEWDFDKEDPEPFGEQPAERTAWKEAENNLTKAKIELEEATKTKTAAETLVKIKEDELDKAREALDNATEENEQILQEALDKVQEELDNARKALVDAEQAVTDKEQKVEECEEAVTKAKEAFMKLMKEYTGKLR